MFSASVIIILVIIHCRISCSFRIAGRHLLPQYQYATLNIFSKFRDDFKFRHFSNHDSSESGVSVMRPRIKTPWQHLRHELEGRFQISSEDLIQYDIVSNKDFMRAYEMMLLCRNFENACNQAYMQGNIRGFMHLDNGQETIPAFVADSIKQGDKKFSYYREHTHALASNISPDKIMAELFGKIGGTCKGAGGSMHIFDRESNFQGGWALVAEQLPYAVGAARSILLDRKLYREQLKNDNRIAIVFVGEGGAQNGRMAECLNAAAKESLPILFIVIDNGRAINTFTPDVAKNSDVYLQGQFYGIPGIKVDGQSLSEVLQTGRAVVNYVRNRGPAILQIHTYRLNGHSPADPEHERGRKDEKRWARAEADPIKLFETFAMENNILSSDEMEICKSRSTDVVRRSLEFATQSDLPPATLAKDLEYPDPPATDYNNRVVSSELKAVSERFLEQDKRDALMNHIDSLHGLSKQKLITIGDAVNLAILEEMMADPTVTIHAEDLQAGSSYNIPKLTQQTFGSLRAADEIIDEGHFIGKALGEAMNGYRPIVELMNTNFGIYGMAELSSAGNTYATTGGQFIMPLSIIGAGGTAPSQALGAEHSQPIHAYVMGIPGLKICTAASPLAAYGLTKSMIKDNGPGILFLPVKMMKDVKGSVDVGKCLPLNKASLIQEASFPSVQRGKAITVITYLHGVKESLLAIKILSEKDPEIGIDLIELRSLKPLDMDTIRQSLKRTHRAVILDESTLTGGVGATISAMIHEHCFSELDAPVKRLCMDDAPVPYASSMEMAVVKRASDLVVAVSDLVKNQF
jgi:TPP-dependent pyruvate/acetoin dehydrogenase alpha subunit/pyruvate/2-oxoglutarate/acetoin dehydrogenase E1 component